MVLVGFACNTGTFIAGADDDWHSTIHSLFTGIPSSIPHFGPKAGGYLCRFEGMCRPYVFACAPIHL